MSEQDATPDEFVDGENQSNWSTEKLDFLLTELLTGNRPTGGGHDEGKYISIGGTQIDSGGYIDLHDLVYIPEEYFEKVSDTQLQRHDILMVKDGANTGDVAILWEDRPDIVTNEHVMTLRLRDDVNPPYIFYYLLSHEGWRQLKGTITGSAQEGMNKSFAGKVEITYPSPEEQHKIASVFCTVDQAIQLQDDLVDQTKRVKGGLMKTLFTEGYNNHNAYKQNGWRCKAKQIPEEWDIAPADDLMTIRRGASPRPRSDDTLFGGDIPWIKIGDADREGSQSIDSVESYVTEKGKSKSEFVTEGSLLVANSGATCGFAVFAGLDGCVHDGWLILEDYEGFDKKYLYHYINWNYEYLRSLSLGSAQTNLSTGLFGRLDIPKPSMEEQREIADSLDSLERQQSQYQTEKGQLESLKQGLMQDLLSGEVQTHDKELEIVDDVLQHG